MPKTAVKFGLELQYALQPMIIKPSQSAGVLVRFAPTVLENVSHDAIGLARDRCVLVRDCPSHYA